MDINNPEDVGVIEWCNGIRFAMARDPGRANFAQQTQKHGFDFLDDYLANVLSRPKEEPMYELLKTPGRRKDAPKRTRAATAAAAKAHQVTTESKDGQTPLNSFHQTLLDVKANESEETKLQGPKKSPLDEDLVELPPRTKPIKVVTIAESPENYPQDMTVEAPHASLEAQVDVVVQLPPGLTEQEAIELEEAPHGSTLPSIHSKELSMIAEDEEPNERSRQSIQPHEHEPIDIEETVPLPKDDATGSHALKPSTSQFAVPAPSPLRKSLRPTHSAGNLITPFTAQTPGPALNSKRTSWLMKAKETRALEMTSTGKKLRPHNNETTGFLFTALPTTGKRKSGEMLEIGVTPPSNENLLVDEDEERHSKLPRLTPTRDLPQSPVDDFEEDDLNDVSMVDDTRMFPKVPSSTTHPTMESHDPLQAPPLSIEDFTVPLAGSQEEDALGRLKRTVEGARAAKSMGKSLGGGAAAELAEARAAAKARVAERHKDEDIEDESEPDLNAENSPSVPRSNVPELPTQDPPSETDDRRLSLSDLTGPPKPASDRSSSKDEQTNTANISGSTTPPCSPPPPRKVQEVPHPPVFTKPPAVFSAPVAGPSQPKPPSNAAPPSQHDFSFKLPRTNPFSLPTAMALGVPPAIPSSSSHQLSAQSSKASILSEVIFDKDDSIPAWMPTTQDTDYSTQPIQNPSQALDDLDEDDSWHVDAKLKADNMWTPFGFASKDDTMTTSTLPSRSTSQKGGDTGPLHATQNVTEDLARVVEELNADQPPSDFDGEGNQAQLEIDEADLEIEDMSIDNDLGDIVAAGKPTIALVSSKPDTQLRSQSQLSMASTSSSSQHSQLGIFGHASKLVSSVFGGGKKTKAEPVKSIQRAAAIAKKQQEEAERKAARLKEMENRRQQAMQRKADEEKARVLEADKKAKEEAERRKKEREDQTDKRPLRSTMRKTEDDTRTRKITIESEKKPAIKKVPSTSRLGKPPGIPATKLTIKSAMKPAKPPQTPGGSKERATAPSSSLRPPNTKGKAVALDEMDKQPAQLVQSQMIHRANAHIQATQPREPPIASENIELPDINSEYSDSEDEGHGQDRPQWAQSPELRQQLQQQSTVNPDHVFGPIVPLQIEDMFKARGTRLKARSSSANWNNGDAVTAEEVRKYNEQMGFK